jgi:hypothetical protein
MLIYDPHAKAELTLYKKRSKIEAMSTAPAGFFFAWPSICAELQSHHGVGSVGHLVFPQLNDAASPSDIRVSPTSRPSTLR